VAYLPVYMGSAARRLVFASCPVDLNIIASPRYYLSGKTLDYQVQGFIHKHE